MHTASFGLAVGLLVVLAGQAQAQGHLAAVLVVEDAQRGELVESVGVAAYSRFLERLPYERLVVLRGLDPGSRRLTGAIRGLAREFAAIDVFLSTHTTRRDPEGFERAIPRAARKIRLVYSTACESYEHERDAWLAVGARTVVVHTGINNPVWAFPMFLSAWLQGGEVGDAVAWGQRETMLGHRFLFSLPGSERVDRRVEAGSVPSIDGDESLTVAEGLVPEDWIESGLHKRLLSARYPPELRYARATGSSLGLIMRALAGRFEASGEDVAPFLEQLQLTYPFDQLDTSSLSRASFRTRQVPVELPVLPMLAVAGPQGLVAALLAPAFTSVPVSELVIEQESPQRVPLRHGLELVFARELWLRPGRLDPQARVLDVDVGGVRLVGYRLSLTLNGLRIQPDRAGGYRLFARGGLFGVLRLRRGFRIGGRRPPPLGRRRNLTHRPRRGALGLLGASLEREPELAQRSGVGR